MHCLTDEILEQLDHLSRQGDPPPWCAIIEGRDQTSGDSFIQIGDDGDRDEDMYVSRVSGPSDSRDLDLIAAARTSLPELIAEIRRLRMNLQH